MSDDSIILPVSAPGAQKTTKELLDTAQAIYTNIKAQEGYAEGSKAFNQALEKEAQTLTGKVTPALQAARREAQIYQAMMKSGQTLQANRFLANAGEGGFISGLGSLERHETHQITRGLAMGLGGGEASHLLHAFGLAATSATAAIGMMTAGVVVGGLLIHKINEAEKERLDEIEAETKLRQDLNKSLKEANEGREDKAGKGFLSTHQARMTIASLGSGASGNWGSNVSASSRIADLEKIDGNDAVKAMAGFLKSKMGKKVSFESAEGIAKEIAGTGIMSFEDALKELENYKGPTGWQDLAGIGSNIVAKIGGFRGKDKKGYLEGLTHMAGDYGDASGENAAYDLHRRGVDQEAKDSRNMGLVMPSMVREFQLAVDPAAVATRKFKDALDETLVPLRARAEAENKVWAALKDGPLAHFIFGSESEQSKLDKAERRTIGVGR